MKKACILFLIILIATILVPMLSFVEAKKDSTNTASKQMVTIFAESSFCGRIVDF